MNKTINALIVAIGSMVAVKTNEYLTLKLVLHTFLSILIAACASILVITLLSSIIKALTNKIFIVRRYTDPRSKFEGTWIIILDTIESRPYSYASIEYNSESEDYIYRGCGFDQNGKLQSHWTSTHLMFNTSAQCVEFRADSQLVDRGGETLRNWGVITFEKESFGKEYTRGKGHFVDDSTSLIKVNFFLDRLNRADIISLVDKKSIRSHDDMAQLIQTYHEKRDKQLQLEKVVG